MSTGPAECWWFVGNDAEDFEPVSVEPHGVAPRMERAHERFDVLLGADLWPGYALACRRLGVEPNQALGLDAMRAFIFDAANGLAA